MNPEEQPAPAPANYDFIFNPNQPPKKPSVVGKINHNSFIIKLAVIVGGALLLMGILAIAASLFFGDKTNVNDYVSLAQNEQEIIRLSDMGEDDATNQTTKNAAINTRLVIKSHQQSWLARAVKNNRTVSVQELNIKKSAKTDRELTVAKQNSTFDTVYAEKMRTQLTAYGALLKTIYGRATTKTEKTLLQNHYKDAQTLLKQWPSSD